MIPFTYMPRSLFNMDDWFKPIDKMTTQFPTVPFPTTTFPGTPEWFKTFDKSLMPTMPTTLDVFDPFDELDTTLGRNMWWLNKPEWMTTPFGLPKVPQKFRITIDIFGYDPKSIKTEFINNKLVVTGKEEVKHEGEDFSIKEFKKTFEIPPNAEVDKLVSFVTGHGQLVLEIPLKEAQFFKTQELIPQIVDKMDGGKEVAMNCTLPAGIEPSKVHVTCKDRDLIIKFHDTKKKPDGISKVWFYKRSSWPENTKFEDLKCTFDNNVVSIKAPLDMEFKPHHMWKSVPIDFKPAVTSK